ncbi:MAG: DUF6152 family protein [Polyangiales bacterium]
MPLTARSSCLVAVAAALALTTAAAHAHHSFAMFDFTKLEQAAASVEEFRWTNPHVVLVVKADGAAGAPTKLWSLELTSPGNLTRTGFSRHSFKPGDRVQIEFHPLRDGRQGGAFKKATFTATGQVLESNLRAQEKPGLQ